MAATSAVKHGQQSRGRLVIEALVPRAVVGLAIRSYDAEMAVLDPPAEFKVVVISPAAIEAVALRVHFDRLAETHRQQAMLTAGGLTAWLGRG